MDIFTWGQKEKAKSKPATITPKPQANVTPKTEQAWQMPGLGMVAPTTAEPTSPTMKTTLEQPFAIPGMKMPLQPTWGTEPKPTEYVLKPNEYIVPQELRNNPKHLELSARGLTREQYAGIIEQWKQRQIKEGNYQDIVNSANKYAKYGYADSAEQWITSELADQAGQRLLGLQSELSHELSDRYTGVTRQSLQAQAQVKEPVAKPFPQIPVVATRTTPLETIGYPGAYGEYPTFEAIPIETHAKVLGESLKYLPSQIGASVLQAGQGEKGASVVNPDWADRYITEANQNVNAFAQDIVKQYPHSEELYELATISQNLAYSLTTMGAGTLAALPLWLTPEPTGATKLAAMTTTGVVSGAISFRMVTYQIVQEYLEFKNQEKIKQTGRGLTLEEENQLKADFHRNAVKYGLWEAIPEGASNFLFSGIFAGAFTNALTKVVGQQAAKGITGSLGTNFVTKMAGMYGEELLTETITQKGQAGIEVEAGLREGRIGWVEAFKEIAPQTMLLTTIMAGAGQAVISSSQALQKVKNSLKNEIGEGHPLYDTIISNVEANWGDVEAAQQNVAMTQQETITGEIPGVSFKPIKTNVGKGYQILQNDQIVGTVSYGTTEALGVEGMMIGRIDVAETARRQGLATQAIDRILTEAESQGVPLYTGLLEPDGVKLFNALQNRGVIKLTPSPQPMLGDTVTRGVPEYAPTTAMAEGETVSGEWRPERRTLMEIWEMTGQIPKLAAVEVKTFVREGFIEKVSRGEIDKIMREGLGDKYEEYNRLINLPTYYERLLGETRYALPEGVITEEQERAIVESLWQVLGREGIAWNQAAKGFYRARKTIKPTAKAVEPTVEPEALSIPPKLPTTPPPLTPEGTALGRSDNDFEGFMADLQDAGTVSDIASRNDMVRKAANNLPGLREFFKILNPSVVANTPAEKAIIIRATLRDEGYQKTQGVIAYLNGVGSQDKIFGNLDSKGFIKEGILKGQTVGDIAQNRAKWESKLTDEQKFWLDHANAIEKSVIKFLERNEIDINLLHLEEGGQFATRRVWAKTLNDGTAIDVAYVGVGPGRPGARLPTEKARFFKTEAGAIEAGYRYIPYEEALYLKVSGAYNRVADKKMADWLLTKVTWRTTGAPEALKIAAEAARLDLRHSQMLLAALNRAVRGERIPDVTIRAIATSYPDQAQELKDLIPKIQVGKPTAKEVKNLTNVAKGLIDTNKMESLKAVAARARAREAALKTKYGESIVPAPAFAGKILTGPEAKETARTLRESFEPSFSKALGQVNKANAVARYFMLAGDFSPFTIQLLFMVGSNPIIYGKAFAGAIRAMVDTKFQAKFLSKHKATIDKHPNLIISKGGGTEFTEAMARGGWLSGKTSFRAEAESYWKSLALFLPRTVGKVGGTVLTPFQRVFESSLDSAGIYLAEAYDHLCTTPENTADVDQFINEFRGLTSSARIGISGRQRQLETSLLLAPRYNRAIAGLLFDLTRGNIRGSLARKSLIKGIAALVAMAVAISIAHGESEDEVLEHLSPNSSNFFTWDIEGQKVGPGSKVRSLLKLIAQSAENPDELLEFSMDNPALRFVRGNLAPVAGSGIDLITGRSYIGDPTRDGMLSFSKEILAGNMLPIWVQSTLLEGGSVTGRTARGLSEFFGGRAYPEPLWDEVGRLRDKYAQQDFDLKYEDLNRAQIDKLKDNHPDLDELEEKARVEQAERGSEFEQVFYLLREETITARDESLEKAATLVLNGTISKYNYDNERGYIRPYYSGGMSVLYGLREHLDPEAVKDIQEWLSENQKPEDKALDEYQEYRASLIEKADLPRDWDEIEDQCEKFLLKYSGNIRNYVKANLNRWINDLPENAKQVELMRLQGIIDETWWDDYRGITKKTYTPEPYQYTGPTWGQSPVGEGNKIGDFTWGQVPIG